jgi:RNA polymerase sigma factor (sigma-70 family)
MTILSIARSGAVGLREADADRSPQSSPVDGDAAVAPGVLARLRDGHPDALRELMASYWQPLLGYVTRMLGCSDSSEDVVQETFVRVWQSRSSLSSEGSGRGLVYEIARNLALKRIRHQEVRTRKAADLRQYFSRTPRTPADQTIATELREALDRAIQDLPVRRREAFVLLRYDGLSLKETALVMGLSTQTVANHAVLAMRQLRSTLQLYRQD